MWSSDHCRWRAKGGFLFVSGGDCLGPRPLFDIRSLRKAAVGAQPGGAFFMRPACMSHNTYCATVRLHPLAPLESLTTAAIV
jgi:hypothetical protein